jgi:hypothetical protein
VTLEARKYCHEGNCFVADGFRAEKVYQDRAREAIENGEEIPARSQGISGRSIFAPFCDRHK